MFIVLTLLIVLLVYISAFKTDFDEENLKKAQAGIVIVIILVIIIMALMSIGGGDSGYSGALGSY